MARAFYPVMNSIPDDDIQIIPLFNPDISIVNLDAKKYGIVFYVSKRKDGTLAEHFCLVNSNLESISCYTKYHLALNAYKRINASTYKYSPDLVVEPLRYTPSMIESQIVIMDNFTGEKKLIDKSPVDGSSANALSRLLTGEVRDICLRLNREAAVSS
jgi:hypothetical protein